MLAQLKKAFRVVIMNVRSYWKGQTQVIIYWLFDSLCQEYRLVNKYTHRTWYKHICSFLDNFNMFCFSKM